MEFEIRDYFRSFCAQNAHLSLENQIELFAIFGGLQPLPRFEIGGDLFSLVTHYFVSEFFESITWIKPEYLHEESYAKFLTALARGSGMARALFRRARIGETRGEAMARQLEEAGVLRRLESREAPIVLSRGQKLKKELRGYRVQDRYRFTKPFLRFWFAFVAPYASELTHGEGRRFLDNFRKHYEGLRSLVFEQLCDALLVELYGDVRSHGSYWDRENEFDILIESKSGERILGECKYTSRPVTKAELNKLIAKAEYSRLKIDTFALFSKSGFSKELRQAESRKLRLFELKDLQALLL